MPFDEMSLQEILEEFRRRKNSMSINCVKKVSCFHKHFYFQRCRI